MKAWDDFLRRLDPILGKETLDRWVRGFKVQKFDAANLYLEAKDAFSLSWFEEHIRPRLGSFFNENGRKIKVHIQPFLAKGNPPPQTTPKGVNEPLIDPTMTFESFVVEEDNRALVEILKNLEFNPIFLFGSPLSGKTHLLTSLAHLLQAKGKKVLFTSASTFTENVVEAIRTGKMQAFRQLHREIDALLIDDVHIFSKKHATQEEFFHTFNALHTIGKPVILTAKVPPKELEEIEMRLVSRFEWGVVLKVNPLETKRLLEIKSAVWNLSLSEESLEFLIQTFSKRALLALQALAVRAKDTKNLNVKALEVLLSDLMEEEKKLMLTPEKLIKKVAEHFELQFDDLVGKSRERQYVQARQIAMFLCREKLSLTLQAIGKIFGKDHSTVLASIDLVKEKQPDMSRISFESS